jgi:alginate O-acetyltransferase complex protein AlgI
VNREKWIPVLGVVLNLAVLGLFKYADFFRGTADALLGEDFHPWRLILPLGISFFVFQKISYLIDLRRGDRHIYGFLDFCMFVMFFPQLIAGPLVRHNEIIHQFSLDPRRPDMWENLSRGFILFVIGVAKKVALADTRAMVADPLFDRSVSASLSAVEAWIATSAYTLQIYFDFSGYSDMAIGLALMFGLRLPMNFNAPYRAVSIRDFWRRWHMTLSRFLRDYLYIPLGGNRCGALRQAMNVVVTMLLGGLWHGANWTFVAWGGLHGAALAVNHIWEGCGFRLPRAVAWAVTLLFVMGCWVLFRSADFTTAGDVLMSMLGQHGIGRLSLDREYVAALIGGAAIALLGPTSQEAALAKLQPKPWLAIPAGVALAYLLLLVGGRLPNVFIYFQF